jgi:hypothetical protein
MIFISDYVPPGLFVQLGPSTSGNTPGQARKRLSASGRRTSAGNPRSPLRLLARTLVRLLVRTLVRTLARMLVRIGHNASRLGHVRDREMVHPVRENFFLSTSLGSLSQHDRRR